MCVLLFVLTPIYGLPDVVLPRAIIRAKQHSIWTAGTDSIELLVDGNVIATATSVANGLQTLTVPANISVSRGSLKYGNTNSSLFEVIILSNDPLLLIQTDKKMYQPGQDVKIRVLAVDRKRLTTVVCQVLIIVTDKDNFILLQQKHDIGAENYGIATASMEIVRGLPLGSYTVKALVVDSTRSDSPDAVATVTFIVDEYVLPTFEVMAQADAYTLVTTEYVGGEDVQDGVATLVLNAKYTSGSSVVARVKVEGQVSYSMDSDPFNNQYFRPPTSYERIYPTAQKVDELELEIPLSDWQLNDISRWDCAMVLHFRITVTDEATGEENGARTYTTLVTRHRAYSFRGTHDHFTPGMPLTIGIREVHFFENTSFVVPPVLVEVRNESCVGNAQSLEVETTVDGYQVQYFPQDDITCCGVNASSYASQIETSCKEQCEAHAVCCSTDDKILSCTQACLYRNTAEPDRPWRCTSQCGVDECNVTNGVETYNACNATKCDGWASASCANSDAAKAACSAGCAFRVQGCCLTHIQIRIDEPECRLPGITDSATFLRSSAPYGIRLEADNASRPGAISFQLFVSANVAEQTRLTDALFVLDAFTGDVLRSDTAFLTDGGSLPDGRGRLTFSADLATSSEVVVFLTYPTFTLVAHTMVEVPLNLGPPARASFSATTVEPGSAVKLHVDVGDTARATFVRAVDRSVDLLMAGNDINVATMEATFRSQQPEPVLPLSSACSVGSAPQSAFAPQSESANPCPWRRIATCNMYYRPIAMQRGANEDMMDDDVMVAEDAPMENMVMDAGADNKRSNDNDSPSAPVDAIAVRKNFPETWLWNMYRNGTYNLTAPDTMTTWALTAFSVDGTHGFSEVPPSTLRVTKDLYAKIRLPYSGIRNETVLVTITVYSHLDVRTTARVALALAAGLETNASLAQEVELEAGGYVRLDVRVRALAIGTHPIRATVSSIHGNTTKVVDVIERAMLIQAEGVPQSLLQQHIVTAPDAELELADARLVNMAGVVPESGFSEIRITGDIMGPSIDNLDHLVRMPHGCGEQNMITLVPNIEVAKYLTAIGSLTPTLRKRIERNVASGYSRELTYRHPDGSFSAFGENDASGSLWLTAFVVLVFSDIDRSGLATVDRGVVQQAVEWMLGTQQPDGSFTPVGMVIHTDMMSGTSNGTSLTAYVLRALARYEETFAGRRLQGDSLGRSWLAASTPRSTYDQVQKFATLIDAFPNLTHDAAGCVEHPELATECSGIMLSAVLAAPHTVLPGAERMSHATQYQRCLLTKMTALGGYGSTQDTVVVLTAMSAYAVEVSSAMQDINATAVVTVNGSSRTFSVSPENAGVLQRVPVPFNATISVNVSGSGKLLVSLASFYNVRQTRPLCDVDVAVSPGDEYKLHMAFACTFKPVMGIVTVRTWTGTAPRMARGRRLSIGTAVKRVEVDPSQPEKISFYYDSIGDQHHVLDIPIKREFSVENSQPGSIELCEYYGEKCFVTPLEFAFVPPPTTSSGDDTVLIVLIAGGCLCVVLLSAIAYMLVKHYRRPESYGRANFSDSLPNIVGMSSSINRE